MLEYTILQDGWVLDKLLYVEIRCIEPYHAWKLFKWCSSCSSQFWSWIRRWEWNWLCSFIMLLLYYSSLLMKTEIKKERKKKSVCMCVQVDQTRKERDFFCLYQIIMLVQTRKEGTKIFIASVMLRF